MHCLTKLPFDKAIADATGLRVCQENDYARYIVKSCQILQNHIIFKRIHDRFVMIIIYLKIFST